MDTTVTTKAISVERTASGLSAGNGYRKPGGPGNIGGNGNGRQREGGREESSFDHFRIGTWVALAAIAMMFTALTSAYIVRTVSPEGTNDWRAIVLPRILWLSTVLILASSVAFEGARRFLRSGDERRYRSLLTITLLLGLGFLTSQLLAWRQLVHQGVYLATNPHSSFFYLLTGVHAVHLLGGIMGLAYLVMRGRSGDRGPQSKLRREAVVGSVAVYWHFIDGLWIYLFLLLSFWR